MQGLVQSSVLLCVIFMSNALFPVHHHTTCENTGSCGSVGELGTATAVHSSPSISRDVAAGKLKIIPDNKKCGCFLHQVYWKEEAISGEQDRLQFHVQEDTENNSFTQARHNVVCHLAKIVSSYRKRRVLTSVVSLTPEGGGEQDWQYVELNVIWHLKTNKYYEWLSLLIFKALCKLSMDWCKWYKGIRMFFINRC